MANTRFLVIGATFFDSIFHGLDAFPRLGTEVFASGQDFAVGGMAITAMVLSQLGAATTYCSSIGGDIFGQIVEDELRRTGLDLLLCETRNGRTSHTVAMAHGNDRAFLSILGQEVHDRELFHRWRTAQATDDFHHMVLHVGLKDDESWQLVCEAADLGFTTSVSISYESLELFRQGSIPRDDWLNVPNLVFCNTLEAQEITGQRWEEALTTLNAGTARTIVTLGANGAATIDDGGTFLHCPALPVSLVDTTGAGDAFAAGVLRGLGLQWPLQQCLRLGTVCGSRTITALGGTAGAPKTLTEARSYLEDLGPVKEGSQ